MPSTTNNKLPDPHIEFAGRNNLDAPGNDSFKSRAALWQPKNTTMEEPACTASRYALRLIDKVTGRAYTADELPNAATTESVLALLAGANLPVDAMTLGDSSGDVLPDGSISGTGEDGEFAWHNDSDTGGKVYKAYRNFVPSAHVAVSNASIIAGTVHAELCRFRLEPSECVVNAKFALMGKVLIQSTGTQTPAYATAATLGIHMDGILSTTVYRGAYVELAGDAAGVFVLNLDLSLGFKLTQVTTPPLAVKTDFDDSVFAISANQNKATLSTGVILNSSFAGASGGGTGPNIKFDVSNGADLVLSLRLTQDASYLGGFQVIAQNLALVALA